MNGSILLAIKLSFIHAQLHSHLTLIWLVQTNEPMKRYCENLLHQYRRQSGHDLRQEADFQCPRLVTISHAYSRTRTPPVCCRCSTSVSWTAPPPTRTPFGWSPYRDHVSISPYRYADAKFFSVGGQFPLSVDIPRAKWTSPPRRGISPPPSRSARGGGTRRAPTADRDWKRSFCSRTGRCWDRDLVRR